MEDHHNGAVVEMVTSIHAGIFNSAQRAITFHFRYLLLVCCQHMPNQHHQHLTIFSLQCIHVHARTYARPAQHELILPEALTRMHETSTCPNPPVQSDTARGIHVPFFGILQRKRVTLHSVVLFVPAV